MGCVSLWIGRWISSWRESMSGIFPWRGRLFVCRQHRRRKRVRAFRLILSARNAAVRWCCAGERMGCFLAVAIFRAAGVRCRWQRGRSGCCKPMGWRFMPFPAHAGNAGSPFVCAAIFLILTCSSGYPVQRSCCSRWKRSVFPFFRSWMRIWSGIVTI